MKLEKYDPPLAIVQELSEKGYSTPIWRELPADLETPVSVYLNGNYWGIYWIREHMDDDYLESHFGIEDPDLLEAARRRIFEKKQTAAVAWQKK